MLIMIMKKKLQITYFPQGFRNSVLGQMFFRVFGFVTFKSTQTFKQWNSFAKMQKMLSTDSRRIDGLLPLIESALYYIVYIALNVHRGKHLTSTETIQLTEIYAKQKLCEQKGDWMRQSWIYEMHITSKRILLKIDCVYFSFNINSVCLQ